jgi:riboflavin kinase
MSSNNNDSKANGDEEEEVSRQEKRKQQEHQRHAMITSMLPIRISKAPVVHGFGRGSTDLGIPTANLDLTSTTADKGGGVACAVPLQKWVTPEELPCGIYWGFCRILRNHDTTATAASTPTNEYVYTTAVSIGYNPTYKNEKKTVEPHLIASHDSPCRHKSSCGETLLEEELYEKHCRLSLVGYLRPELPFAGLDKLIVAIQQDIQNAERFGADLSNPVTRTEKKWVASQRDALATT